MQKRMTATEQRLDEQGKQLGDVNEKLDKLLQLMSSQPTGATKNSSTGTAESEYGTGLLLDIYVLDPEEIKKKGIPEEAPEISLGTLVDAESPVLKFNAFKRDKQFSKYANNDWLAFKWSGYIQIDDAGKHVVGLEIQNDKDIFVHACTLRGKVAGNSALRIDVEFDAKRAPNNNYFEREKDSYGDTYYYFGYTPTRRPQVAAHQAVLDLKPGLYPVSIWQYCRTSSPKLLAKMDYDKTITTLLLRGPQDRALAPVPKDRLLHHR